MKSNISQKDINSGKKIIERLSNTNPRLIPSHLKKDLPEYQKFIPDIKKYGIWCSLKSFSKNKETKYDKIVFLASGLAAAGKDSIYNEMINLAPNLFYKIITATSRSPRENETNEIDYFFYQPKDFLTSLKNNEFLEFIKRGETYYGLPKKSLDHAFNQPKPIIYCQIEMSGWSRLEKYIKSKYKNTLIIKAFIMPDMSVSEYVGWLTQERKQEDLESRVNKSGWEIQKAATKANIIITNRIRENIPTLNYLAKTIINQIIELGKLNIPKFETPTDNLNHVQDHEDIIITHDNLE
jgi:guanylate kinase